MRLFVLVLVLVSFGCVNSQSSGDASAMQDLKRSLNSPRSLGWENSNPCIWRGVYCRSNRIIGIQLKESWVSGVLPQSLSNLTSLESLELQKNQLTGPFPSLKGLESLHRIFIHENNFTYIPSDFFSGMSNLTEFKLDNNPFSSWGLYDSLQDCKTLVNLSANFVNMSGQIPGFLNSVNFPSLVNVELAGNSLEGELPYELTSLGNLKLDVSHNRICGEVPAFNSSVIVKTGGNADLWKNCPFNTSTARGANSPGGSKTNTGLIVGVTLGVIVSLLVFVGLLINFLRNKYQSRGEQPTVLIHPGPQHSPSGREDVQPQIVGRNENDHRSEIVPAELNFGGSGNIFKSIQILRSVTNNFNMNNILGKGGFGTVYKGILHDGTTIAVKRMELGVMGEKGLDEFTSEVAVLTKVRHRHLVALLGFCVEGRERLLVYEYMPRGTLTQHLFKWKEEGLTPLEWTKRLIIALDVARGVEYLHSLAQHTFVHRDLKPSNILLSDDMRAKVADFGLVRLVPDGKTSLATKLAGTFGYLAPEYAATGRITTKVDVYSFGVILMEIITGKKALDETRPEECTHLVPWFHRMLLNKDEFYSTIDPSIDLDEETLTSINTVAELARHCTLGEPNQRPDMSYVVNALSSLAELWEPSEPEQGDNGVECQMSLAQAVKKWQAQEGMTGVDSSSSYLAIAENTQTSMPRESPASEQTQ